MIEQGRHSIDLIAREAGFGDRHRMRRAFMRATGIPPQAVRRSAREEALTGISEQQSEQTKASIQLRETTTPYGFAFVASHVLERTGNDVWSTRLRASISRL